MAVPVKESELLWSQESGDSLFQQLSWDGRLSRLQKDMDAVRAVSHELRFGVDFVSS